MTRATDKSAPAASGSARRRALLAAATAALAWSPAGRVLAQGPAPDAAAPTGRILRVGPGQTLRRIADAAAAAGDGDTVEVEAGDYLADTAVWRQRHIRVRAVGGPVRLLADGANAQGKGIWVVRSAQMEVEGLEFSGARVPDRNGAGIRHERGRLLLRDCRFTDNENGVLVGNDPQAELDLEGCSFERNGAGDGYSHNLYVGRIGRLRALGCQFRQARVGHLLKSRAAVNEVLACVLDDGPDGSASYELEFPDGGDALVAGCLIAQSAQSQNPAMVSFAAEVARGERQRLRLLHNTLIDRRSAGGRFIDLHRVAPAGVLQAWNNLRAGNGRWPAEFAGVAEGNIAVPPTAFLSAARGDFRLGRPTTGGWAAVPMPADIAPPTHEIAWPAGHRPAAELLRWIGALPPAAQARAT